MCVQNILGSGTAGTSKWRHRSMGTVRGQTQDAGTARPDGHGQGSSSISTPTKCCLEVVPQASCLHRSRGSCRLEACGTNDLALSRSILGVELLQAVHHEKTIFT